ncbi:MAG: 3'-5' exonuclease, partial [Limisphaerales bacterium]
LKFVSNPSDELSFKRIVRMLQGVGGKGADKLWNTFVSVFSIQSSAASDGANRPVIAAAMQKCNAAVPKKAVAAWAQLSATIAQLEVPPVRGNASKMITLVMEAIYEDYLKQEYANYRQRQEDIEQLSEFAVRFETLEEFLTQLALLTNVEAEGQQAANKDDEQIRLSTIHQAKGLEFDVVFVIMLCDGLFPSNRSLDTAEGEEEERRLFYVAVTRAKNELYLSYPLIRITPGNTGDIMQSPSRFLGEIPKDLVDEWNLRPFNPYG